MDNDNNDSDGRPAGGKNVEGVLTLTKGSSFGYPFLFFSAIFFGFLAFILSSGGSQWLVASSMTFNTTNTTDYQNVGWDVINPFSSIGFLAWLSVGIALVDGYIIVSSIT